MTMKKMLRCKDFNNSKIGTLQVEPKVMKVVLIRSTFKETEYTNID